jgi:pimeloyl-ACP methyl ester carboxylesterase
MTKTIFNGVPIQYRCIGEGRDVVLIHGLGANLGFWNPSLLLPLAREYRVTVFDLRGHGYSGMPVKGYTSAHMAEDVYNLLENLKIGRADLIGHSFGGVVALHSALLFPEKVNSLVLADTRVRAFQPTQGPTDWMDSEKIVKHLSDLGFVFPEHETEAGLWLLEKLASPEWREKRHQLKSTQAFVPFAGWNGSQRAADRWLRLLNTTSARNDLVSLAGLTRERLMAIQQPVLAICCENSTALRSMEAMKSHMKLCEAHVIPHSGHFFPLTHPKMFLQIVKRFLGGVVTERRTHERVSKVFSLGVRGRGKDYIPAMTVDVSLSGLLIEGALKMELGSQLELQAGPLATGQWIRLHGIVVRLDSSETLGMPRYGIELLPDSKNRMDWEAFVAA